MSFKQFLSTRPVTDDPEGDFVMDAKADVVFPDATRWSDVEAHCRIMGWCPEAREAALVLWGEYVAQVLP